SEQKSATLAKWNSISLFKIIELQQDKEDVEKAFRTLNNNYITERVYRGGRNQYEQYLLFFEGVNPEDEEQHSSLSLDYDNDYQAFLNETDENITTPVTYHTECGSITENEASLMLQQLLNSSTRHAITKQNTLD
ncbi:hypothetical protein GcM3_056038, partial [Golovinomyces cichoracearum]